MSVLPPDMVYHSKALLVPVILRQSLFVDFYSTPIHHKFDWPGFCLPLECIRILPFCNNDQIKSLYCLFLLQVALGGVSQAQGRCVSPAFWTTYL